MYPQIVNESQPVNQLFDSWDRHFDQSDSETQIMGAFPFNQNFRFEFPVTSSSEFNSIFLREVYPNFRNFFPEVSFPVNLTHNTPELYP